MAPKFVEFRKPPCAEFPRQPNEDASGENQNLVRSVDQGNLTRILKGAYVRSGPAGKHHAHDDCLCEFRGGARVVWEGLQRERHQPREVMELMKLPISDSF